MILSIEDYNEEPLGALMINPNNNTGNIEIINTKGNISIADIDFDDIFNSNDTKLRISLDDINNYEEKAEKIVDDIVSVRKGEMYDEEILDIFVKDFYVDEIEEIKNIVDKKMTKYLSEDNMTVL